MKSERIRGKIRYMSKSLDLRKATVTYHLAGHTLKETSEIFGVGKSTISEWTKKYKETGDLSNKPLNRGFKKIDPEKLREYVKKHPDATQQEMAEIFHCSDSAIGKAFQKNKITRKKDYPIS